MFIFWHAFLSEYLTLKSESVQLHCRWHLIYTVVLNTQSQIMIQLSTNKSIIIDNTNIDDIDSEEYTKMYDQIMDIILPGKDEGL